MLPRLESVLSLSELVSRQKPKIRHIASAKSRYTAQLRAIFDRAGFGLDCAFNRVKIPGHVGPHGGSYNRYILGRLRDAVDGHSGSMYRTAIVDELLQLRYELKHTDLGDLLRAAASGIDR